MTVCSFLAFHTPSSSYDLATIIVTILYGCYCYLNLFKHNMTACKAKCRAWGVTKQHVIGNTQLVTLALYAIVLQTAIACI